MNELVREWHNEYRREWWKKARKYDRNLGTRGFPLEEIERRVGQNYGELARYAAGWIASK